MDPKENRVSCLLGPSQPQQGEGKRYRSDDSGSLRGARGEGGHIRGLQAGSSGEGEALEVGQWRGTGIRKEPGVGMEEFSLSLSSLSCFPYLISLECYFCSLACVPENTCRVERWADED